MVETASIVLSMFVTVVGIGVVSVDSVTVVVDDDLAVVLLNESGFFVGCFTVDDVTFTPLLVGTSVVDVESYVVCVMCVVWIYTTDVLSVLDDVTEYGPLEVDEPTKTVLKRAKCL